MDLRSSKMETTKEQNRLSFIGNSSPVLREVVQREPSDVPTHLLIRFMDDPSMGTHSVPSFTSVNGGTSGTVS